MLIDQLLMALIRSPNEAADDVLVEAVKVGNEAERLRALDALLRRRTVRGLGGVIGMFDGLPQPLQQRVVRDVRHFHQALRETGRSDDPAVRVSAIRLIALGRQGRLAYVLSENLHDSNEAVARAAADAVVALAKWVAAETRALQAGSTADADGIVGVGEIEPAAEYALLVEQRPEIESVAARALDVHRGRHGQDLLRAVMLLCDSPASWAFRILATPKHGGQSPLVRRLQQPPTAEHVDAFLLGAAHGHLRSHFGTAMAHVADPPALDGLLRRTHWLKDHGLALCVQQVGRGAWWGEAELRRDLDRRRPEDAARVAEWLVASGSPDAVLDARLEAVRQHAQESVAGRLRLLRAVARRRRGGSVALFKSFLADPDERIARMAAREVLRRRPPGYENELLQLMTAAAPSVRRVVGRAIGEAGFEHFWNKFDRLAKPVRAQAGRAMLKLLPDARARLRRRVLAGPVEQRLKALQVVDELEQAEAMRDVVLQVCKEPDARVRSKAVLVAGGMPTVLPEALVDRLLNDADPRVRANAIEVLERRPEAKFVPVLAERARSATNRERANAIKALFRMRVDTVSGQLFTMLRDGRPEHRISAMWVLRQIGWWQLLNEVGRLAKQDENVRVRRYALTMLKGVAEAAATARAGVA